MRVSFRDYWRANMHRAYLPSSKPGKPQHSRRIRRKWVKEWWKEDGKREAE